MAGEGALARKFLSMLARRRRATVCSGRMKLISWNVNGIRAALKKGFLDFLRAEDAEIVCVQETKAHPDDVDATWPGYEAHWNWAEKRGYSGVLTLTKKPALGVTRGIGLAEHDREGRVLATEFTDFFLVNVYVPNSQRELTRLDYRQRWDRDFLAWLRAPEGQREKPRLHAGGARRVRRPRRRRIRGHIPRV
jgi:exodeoxyribonuclease III